LGETYIQYTIQEVPDFPIPDWLEFDIYTAEVSGLAPRANETTTFPIYIVSQASYFTSEVKKRVNINVKPYSKLDEVVVAQAITTASVALGATAVATQTAITSFSSGGTSGSSASAIWSIVNQLQFMMLLLAFESYVHQDISSFIKGYSFMLFNLNFIPSQDAPGLNFLSEWMDKEQPNEILNDLDLGSRSTFSNSFTLIIFLILITALYFSLKYLFKDCQEEENAPWYKKIWN